MRRTPLLVIAAALALSAPALAAEPETYAFQLKVGTANCKVEYPRADYTTLYLLLTKDGTFNAGAYRPRWEIVDGKDTDSEKHLLTLVFSDAGTTIGKTTSQWGGYSDGFNQGVWSAWESGKKSDDAMALLNKSSMVTVIFDGGTLATFDTKQKGFAANTLKACVKNLG